MASNRIANILDDLEKKSRSFTDNYELGTQTIQDRKNMYESHANAMYKCIDDLYNKPNAGVLSSQDHLVNVLMPQLRFINELTHVVNSFPHKTLPTTTAFLAELMERAKYTMGNIKNFNGMVEVTPSISLAEKRRPTIPYQQLQGGKKKIDHDDGVYEGSESDEEAQHPGDFVVHRKSTSKKNPKNETEDDSPAIVLDTSSDESAEKSDDSSSNDSEESEKQKKKSKKKDAKKSREVLSNSDSSSDTKKDAEKSASASSDSVEVIKHGGARRVKRKVRKTKMQI